MNMEQQYMVTVCVCTFQQEKWIRQTLDSILNQVTQYKYEVIIGEDYGSDHTRMICKEYADKYDNVTLLSSSHNVGITENWISCIQAGSGKYIMSCAGDDYWHNRNKIQLQVDFMEQHPDCCACHTDIDELYNRTNRIAKNVKQKHKIVPPEGKIQQQILHGQDYISAVTLCIRRSTFEQFVPVDEFIKREFPREDWPTLLILSAHGNILYLPMSTATYRVGQESITRTLDYEKIFNCVQKDREMLKYLYTLFPEWGTFDDESYFDNIGYHYALIAAYRNNDYHVAKLFASKDIYRSSANYFVRTWLTFELYRLVLYFRRKL